MSGTSREGERECTEKEARFAREYAGNGFNATQAYLVAFPATKSYTAARKAASELLTLPRVQKEVEACKREYLQKTRITATRVLREIGTIAFMDAGQLFTNDETGTAVPKDFRELTPADRKLISGIKVKRRRLKCKLKQHDESCPQFIEEVEDVEYKLRDKERALEQLCRYLGLNKDGAALEKLLEMLSSERVSIDDAKPVSADKPHELPPASGG